MGKVMRHTLGASLNIRHNLSSSTGPKPLHLKLLTTYIRKTIAFPLAFSTSERVPTARASARTFFTFIHDITASARNFCRFFFQAEDGIRDHCVTGVQTCALPILAVPPSGTIWLTGVTVNAARVLTVSLTVTLVTQAKLSQTTTK